MDNFSENIIKEIEARGIVPKPRWYFLVSRGSFWLLAICSVAIGAIAFAVAVFVFLDNDGISAVGEALIIDVAQSIPFIWLFVLALFSACAYFGFRHTRTGYRYATSLVVLAVIVMSIVLGIVLDEFDFGQRVHRYLLTHTPLYDPLIHSRDDESD